MKANTVSVVCQNSNFALFVLYIYVKPTNHMLIPQ